MKLETRNTNLVLTDFSLKNHNTFALDVCCRCFFEPANEQELLQFVDTQQITKHSFFVLGGGSNVLLMGDFEGCIIHPAMNFIRKTDENDDDVFLQVGAGVVWDDFVQYCVQHNYYGVENLSWIPGCVGAAPVQNIGAYGVEAQQVIHSVRYLDLACNTFKTIANADCCFGYRSSIFKQSLKNKAIVTAVTFVLQKKPLLQTHYEVLKQELAKCGEEVTLQNVRDTVIHIRKNKLPDPAVMGNAGSFFKNPVVSKGKAAQLRSVHSTMPCYDSNDEVKISAAWLIEQCGWRGKRKGNVGVHPQQALVIVNYGGATGSEVLALSQAIADDVLQQFDIQLDREVCVVDNYK
ncbi:UDP-N-acetylenolpyruvoylglucosamine reductase [Bacteroidia bacterium]|nr:UDP-N-acetylenolpyruvoylglucosamine reductase [Bacteroidia bacterium]